MSEHVFDREAWVQRDIFYQMGNIGSEVGRALSAKRRGNEKDMLAALYRGIDLMNATIAGLIAQKSPRAKEVLRAREQFAESILTSHTDPSLEKYFMEFAIAARRGL